MATTITETIELAQPIQPQQQQTVKVDIDSSSSSSTTATPPTPVEPSSAVISRKQRVLKRAKEVFIRYWFLLGLGIVIGLAWAFPQVGKAHGSIESQYSVKWGAVIIIFLLSGLGLEVSVMLKTILRWRLHLLVQVLNFILLPFLMYGIVRFFLLVNAQLDKAVYKGWMIALSTSTTVSSNAIMTRNANGNDGAGFFFVIHTLFFFFTCNS